MRVTTITDELQTFRASLRGIRTVVYADLKSKMVLGSASGIQAGQEAFDALAKSCAAMVERAENSGALAVLDGGKNGLQAVQIEGEYGFVVVTEPTEGDEACLLYTSPSPRDA